MPNPRLLIFNDGFTWEDLADIPRGNIEVTCIPNGERARLLSMIPDFDAYMPSLRIRVDAEILVAAKKLKLIASNATGTDHFDLPILEQRKIALLTIKHDRDLLDQITTTAELAFGLLLTCARHLPECFEATRQGYWGRQQFAGIQLTGKTLGIIGVGRLGTIMSQYGRAFRMRILAHDPFQRKLPEGIEMTSLDNLLAQSDFISVHVHLTEQTKNLLGKTELGKIKRGASLINTSRGGLIDEKALIEEMESGRIAAVGLDVIDGEWIEDKFNHPLIAYSRKNSRLYITPHVGGTSPDAVKMSARFTFQKAVQYFQEHPLV